MGHSVITFRTPFGRIAFTKDKGDVGLFGYGAFASHLAADVIRHNGKHERYDLGSGLTTQALALALAAQGTSAANTNTLGLTYSMASGTSSTAATAYDYELGALTTSTTQTGGVTAGSTVTLGVSGDNATIQFVNTLNYNAAVAVVEFGLFAGSGIIGSQYNTAANAFTATTATPTTSPTWTANTWAGSYIAQVASATSVIGLITSNTATALTVAQGWVDQTATGGAGATPAANTALNIYPLMADHKVFAAINVASGDSIQFTYTLTVQSGN